MTSRDLYALGGCSEDHPVYSRLEKSNNFRYYDFLFSSIQASIDIGTPLFSHSLIKAINLHAIAGLHHEAGEYRSRFVRVGDYIPPQHDQVQPLMDEFVESVDGNWDVAEPTILASYVLWRINNIHPFVNGNGRTARAVCYFVLCVKIGALLPGKIILPELLRDEPVRQRYVAALSLADQDIPMPLILLIREQITKQISSW